MLFIHGMCGELEEFGKLWQVEILIDEDSS